MRSPLAAWCRSLVLLGIGTVSVPVAAQMQLGQVITEPNNWPVPQRAPDAELSCCVTGRGYPASAGELAGVFAWNQDATVDWIKDAKAGPGVFSPLCGFSGKLLLRGGACKLDFGWYNVPANGAAPKDSDIHVIIPKTDRDIYGAAGGMDFCPLAGMSTQPGSQMNCTAAASKAFSAADIRNSADYAGGLVGFALKGDPNSTCRETHFSQNELHAKHSSGKPWIMSLIYESKAFPDSYYLAFEDRAASAFGPNSMTDNDGDFNDFVFFITGVTCEGGGQPCDASIQDPTLKGACTAGRTGCAPVGGASMERECVPVVQKTNERCDNIDNDCDGVVDNGNLCGAGEVCDKGTCVAACNSGEFKCSPPLECNPAGYCVEPACKDLVCNDGQVCRGGKCIGGCEGAVCPAGQECQLGRCVELCAGVKCGEDQVCEKGACISACTCRTCPTGEVCDTKSLHCVDTGCETKTCAASEICVMGQCQDKCAGALCPGGAACANGVCGDPLPMSSGSGGMTGTAGGISIGIGSGGRPPIGTNNGGTVNGAGATGRPGGRPQAESSGCGCRLVPNSSLSLGPIVLALGVWAARRRRQRRPVERI